MPDILEVAKADVETVLAAGCGGVEVAVVLGSGLSGVAESVGAPSSIAYSDLPGFPHLGSVAGQPGQLVAGDVGDVRAAFFLGRVHMYQGATALECAYTVRLAAALGAKTVVLTNASGGLDPDLAPGNIVLLTDHINLSGATPLAGYAPEGGSPFVAMGDAYDPALRALAYEASMEADVLLREGVYAMVPGPQYETPAEAAMLRRLGADVVGMSTVPETIAARALGMRVLGLSLVANVAGGAGLSHTEVLEAGERAEGELTALLTAILSRL